MSLKNSYTTSDCLQWDSATNLVRKLYRDKNYRISLLVGCGIFFGLRISDLLQLTWEMLLSKDAKFTITEKKTSKRREVRINKEFQKHIKDCYTALNIQNLNEFCFLSGKGKNKVYSIQWINIVLKELKSKYNLKIDHFSTHSLRKTFGRKVFESSENIIRKSKFPQNPKRSVRFSGKRTKRSVQKRKARNTQKAETKVL